MAIRTTADHAYAQAGLYADQQSHSSLCPASAYLVSRHQHCRRRPERAAHNYIHDAPQYAISYTGTDHVIEFNDCHDVALEMSDVGVIGFSLASEISGEQGRSKSTAVMFFVMIVSIIVTAATLSRMLVDYSPQHLQSAFVTVALVALGMGLLGLLGLEARQQGSQVLEKRYRLKETFREVHANPQVTLFFVYLVLMLAAVLGQDVLLEPFAARAFDLPIDQTTRITSFWGTCYLVSLIIAGTLEGRVF